MDCPSDSYAAIQDENGQMGYVGYDDGVGSAVNVVNAESEDREGGEGGSGVPDNWKLLWYVDVRLEFLVTNIFRALDTWPSTMLDFNDGS
ncbi:hypothetical protein GYMLUDRAFT_881039 [Collybiopsis luxurians FD-317 M1]|uniref:Uncharacterized protein n=1 Tax=Collybiopsis luxurians FD-317 M1 TaxID=944289 RepID=A0A0D0AWZ1_9AGAR|nr:hypothetical protein GYMLUDRAFT_881039 [Collybiopsis luxurians FD-317 M1]